MNIDILNEQLDVYLQYRQQLIDEHIEMKQEIQSLKDHIKTLQQDVDIYKFLLHSIVTKLDYISQLDIPNEKDKKLKISIKSKK